MTRFLAYFLCAWLLHGAGHNLVRQLLGGGDAYQAGFAAKLFSTTFSPWNPYVQLGQYTFANTQFQPFYPPGLIIVGLLPNTFGYNLFILLHYALAGYFCYLFCRQLDLDETASFGGGLVFLCCGFLMAHKGHQAMLTTSVWLPLMLLFVARRQPVYAGVALAMSLLAGFPQVTLYGLFLVAAFWFYQDGKRAFAGLSLCGFAGFLLSSLQLFAVAEALPHITRQSLTFASFNENSLPKEHLLGYLLPNILGGLYDIPSYTQNAELVEVFTYCGMAPLLLAIIGIRRAWFWAAAFAVALVLSLGLPPIQAILFKVPVYNLFRAPARHLHEMHFALAMLAAYGLHHFRRAIFPILVAALGLGTSIYLAHHLRVFPNVVLTLPQAEYWRAIGLTWPHPTVLYPVLALAASALCLLAAPRPFLFLVLLADVWLVHHKIYDNPDTTNLYGFDRRSEVSFLFEQGFDPSIHRTLPLDLPVFNTYPLLNMMYGIPVANDYTPMWMKRYQSITGFDLSGAGGEQILPNRDLVSSLSIRFILAKSPASAFAARRTRLYNEVALTHDGITIFENPAVLSRFRFATDLLPSGNPQANQAVVENLPARQPAAPGRIVSQKLSNNKLTFQLHTDGPAFFVVADTWFPGWTATVNGQPAHIHLTNGCVRGVFLPGPGPVTLEMSFWPKSLTYGLLTTLLGFCLVILIMRKTSRN